MSTRFSPGIKSDPPTMSTVALTSVVVTSMSGSVVPVSSGIVSPSSAMIPSTVMVALVSVF